MEKGKRIGMIGLDTGHSVAFTKALNDPLAGDKYDGYGVSNAKGKKQPFYRISDLSLK